MNRSETSCSPGLVYRPVTMYWESPEKAQSHIQPLEVSPGLLLLMLSSVMREKFDVLQILQVWSAEHVASSLEGTNINTTYLQRKTDKLHLEESMQVKGRSRGVWAELAAQGVAFVCRDLGLGNQLGDFVSHSSSQVPHIAVSLQRNQRGLMPHMGVSRAASGGPQPPEIFSTLTEISLSSFLFVSCYKKLPTNSIYCGHNMSLNK